MSEVVRTHVPCRSLGLVKVASLCSQTSQTHTSEDCVF